MTVEPITQKALLNKLNNSAQGLASICSLLSDNHTFYCEDSVIESPLYAWTKIRAVYFALVT